MNEHPPALIPAVGEEDDADRMIRGDKMRLFPSPEQEAVFAAWGKRCVSLWNVLRDLQMAAYSGENTRSKLAWRAMWERIVRDDRAEAERVYRDGKQSKGAQRKDGTWVRAPHWIKEPGEGREEEREALKEARKGTKKNSRAYKEISEKLKLIAARPEPLNPPDLMQRIGWEWHPTTAPLDDRSMRGLFSGVGKAVAAKDCDHSHAHTLAWLKDRNLLDKADSVIAWLIEQGGVCDCKAAKTVSQHYKALLKDTQPQIFLWDSDLQKIMARLKQHPLTRWIGELPSHAAQKTVADMVKAISTMLSERRKAATGQPSRNTGFPRFKPNRPANWSVFFVYTQIAWRMSRRQDEAGDKRGKHRGALAWIKFPNGVGWVRCRVNRNIAEAFARGEADFAQGRLWQQGGQWWFSAQWKLKKPARLAPTGRTAGVKIDAAKITIHNDRGQIDERPMPEIDRDLLVAHRLAGKAQSRALEAAKRKKKKIEGSGYSERRRKRLLEAGKKGKPLRLQLSPGFKAAAAKLARLEADDSAARDGWLHEITTEITRDFDVVSVQKMDVKQLMKKPSARRRLERRKRADKEQDRRKRASLKLARQMMRRMAMARGRMLLKYKLEDYRGPHAYIEGAPLEPEVQACNACGVLNPQMKDGRKVTRCEGCGCRMERNVNAAANAYDRGRRARRPAASVETR